MTWNVAYCGNESRNSLRGGYLRPSTSTLSLGKSTTIQSILGEVCIDFAQPFFAFTRQILQANFKTYLRKSRLDLILQKPMRRNSIYIALGFVLHWVYSQRRASALFANIN